MNNLFVDINTSTSITQSIKLNIFLRTVESTKNLYKIYTGVSLRYYAYYNSNVSPTDISFLY